MSGAHLPSAPSASIRKEYDAGDKYGVRSSDILVELGRRKTIGGQEDMIEDVALNLREAMRAGSAR